MTADGVAFHKFCKANTLRTLANLTITYPLPIFMLSLMFSDIISSPLGIIFALASLTLFVAPFISKLKYQFFISQYEWVGIQVKNDTPIRTYSAFLSLFLYTCFLTFFIIN